MSADKYVQFARPFIEATKEVFSSMVHSPISPQRPTLKQGTHSHGDVSAIIGMSGTFEDGEKSNEFKGQFVISFPMETYLKAASAMLMEEYTEYNDEIADVGAEICNIIIGNTKRELSEMGFKIEMAIPSTVMGKDHKIKYPTGVHVVLIPVESKHGIFFMEICFKGF